MALNLIEVSETLLKEVLERNEKSFLATKLVPSYPVPVRALVRLGVVKIKALLNYSAEHKNPDVVIADFCVQNVHHRDKFDVFKGQMGCTLLQHLSLGC